MRSFPSHLTPDNIKNLKNLANQRELMYIRRHIYESMLLNTFSIPDNCGINLQDVYMGKVIPKKFKLNDRLLSEISSELHTLGFETALCYGDTVLFVYTPGTTPPQLINCSEL